MCTKPIFCSEIAQKAQICTWLLEPQLKLHPTAKVAGEHIRDRPTSWSLVLLYSPLMLWHLAWRSHGLFSLHSSISSQGLMLPGTMYLKPWLHSQRYEPNVLIHTSCSKKHVFRVLLHSLMSAQMIPFPVNPVWQTHSKWAPFFATSPRSLHFSEVTLNEQFEVLPVSWGTALLLQEQFPSCFLHQVTGSLCDLQISLHDSPVRFWVQKQLAGGTLQAASLLQSAHVQTNDLNLADDKFWPEMLSGVRQTAPFTVTSGFLDNQLRIQLKWQSHFSGLFSRWIVMMFSSGEKVLFWIPEMLQSFKFIVFKLRRPIKASDSI